MILWRWKKLKVCNRLGAKGLRERNERILRAKDNKEQTIDK